MKEQLSNLMDYTHEYIIKKQAFDENRKVFDCKVELETKREGTIEYYKTEDVDSYDAAKKFFNLYLHISSLITYIRKEHPKYGVKRIKSLVSQTLSETYIIDEEIRANADQIVDNYMLYENCGFKELYQQDQKLGELKDNMEKMGVALFDESKQIVLEAGQSAISILKPYKEYSKDKLEETSRITKNFISGGKQLVKIIEKMTSDESHDE